jgi:signal peptidase II
MKYSKPVAIIQGAFVSARARSTQARSRHALRLFVGVMALAIVAIDQLTKWWAETTLERFEYTPILGELLGWRLVYNPGAAFGLAAEYTWVLTIFAALAVVGLTIFAWRNTNPWWGVGIASLLGGAISHLGDRLLREPGFALGHIVDFIDYAGFFVGNVADIFLVLGALYLVVLSLFHKDVSESEPGELLEQERS